MTADDVLAGDWTLLIDEAPADLAMSVTFDSGVLRENGLEVGRYQVFEHRIDATMGEDITLIVDLPDLSPLLPGFEPVTPNLLTAISRTRIPEAAGLPEMDGNILVESAVLSRVTGGRASTPRATTTMVH